jgi:hypothetical protein
MSEVSKKKSPLEVADLMLLHNPDASMETIAHVISEWGDLSDDHRFGDAVDMETAKPNGQSPLGSLNLD